MDAETAVSTMLGMQQSVQVTTSHLHPTATTCVDSGCKDKVCLVTFWAATSVIASDTMFVRIILYKGSLLRERSSDLICTVHRFLCLIFRYCCLHLHMR